MGRLYKFLFLLFLALFGVSYVYGTLISWFIFEAILSSAGVTVHIGEVPFTSFLKLGLFHAFLYSLVMLLCIIFLLRKSAMAGQKFTLRNIIAFISWFFLLTTLVYLIYFISFNTQFESSVLLLLAGPQFGFPLNLWFPFLLAWLSLFIILYARIKKTP